VVEAKIVPAMQLLLPQLAQLKEVGRNLIDLANSYQESGDQASAESALQMAADLGQTLWLNKVNERVFDSGCKRGLSAEADLSTMLKTRFEAGSLITV
jgi:hypothetical protein